MINKRLQNILIAMMKKDQEIRSSFFHYRKKEDSKNSSKNDSKNNKKVKFYKIDKANTEKLKIIIEQYGWPNEKLVGKKACLAAWLIAQHADHDVRFQKRCLKILEKEVDKKTISTQNLNSYLALLTDRLLVNSGKYQKYGTQFYRNKKGEYKNRPIADIKNLEKRRRSMGLEPFKVYKKRMLDFYKNT
ncbi:MAG: hypothetical protein QY321_04125 [Patescibacteria group bacterium]|nr:MAG: hypothetical protein QY321_04125 [Patescibacteria group bacterium]